MIKGFFGCVKIYTKRGLPDILTEVNIMPDSVKNQKWVMNRDVGKKAAAGGIERKVLAYCDDLMCVENYFGVGGTGALHSHPHKQITYVVEGRYEFTLGDEKRIINKGDTVFIPGGEIHGVVCIEKGLLLDFFTPMREDFI